MNFVDVFEFFCRMCSEHTRESRRKASTNHHMHVAFTRMLIKRQKSPNIGQIIGGTDNVNSSANKLFSDMGLGSGWAGQHDHIDIEWIVQRSTVDACAITETVCHHLNAIASFVTQHNVVVIGRHELSRETCANRADAKDSDASHVSRDQGPRARATRQSGVEQHPIRGAERRRRRAPPCRWQPWPVGSFSSWG